MNHMKWSAAWPLATVMAQLTVLAGSSIGPLWTSPHPNQPARYSVDLDQPPHERWRSVFDDVLGRLGVRPFFDYYTAVLEGLRQDHAATYAFCRAHVDEWEQAYAKHLPDALAEIYALADALSAHATRVEERQALTREQVFLVQLHMQLDNIGAQKSGECTSVVVRRPAGDVAHFRNWDFGPLPDILGALSVEVDFKFGRTGRHGFRCLLALTHIEKWTTCMKPGHFSMSLNARGYGRGHEHGRPPAAELALLQSGYLPRVGLLRQVMMAGSYDEALATAACARMLTSMYLILAGPPVARSGSKHGRGAVVTLESNESSADIMPLPAPADGWFIVQTNVDHWLPMSDENPSSRRRDHVQELLRLHGQNASIGELYFVLQNQEVFPAGRRAGADDGRVFRTSTIASVLMLPGAAAIHQGNSSWAVDVWRPGSSRVAWHGKGELLVV
mmetsp:Transcript_49692/g.144131  ORF Transcript_49692/g.144131 Transcript_49692/m.144131 type:complete len:445 (-) Transcript_49692:58-1392(-)